MHLKLALILLAFAVAPCGLARADPAYDLCIKRSDGTNSAWDACGGAWITREDARLNAAWKRVHPMLEGTSAQALLAEQRAWIAYKDASCEFYATGDYGREGQVIHYPMCRAGVIAARTQDLEQVARFLNQGR